MHSNKINTHQNFKLNILSSWEWAAPNTICTQRPQTQCFPFKVKSKAWMSAFPVNKGTDAHVSLLTQSCRGSKAGLTKREEGERKKRREQQTGASEGRRKRKRFRFEEKKKWNFLDPQIMWVSLDCDKEFTSPRNSKWIQQGYKAGGTNTKVKFMSAYYQ